MEDDSEEEHEQLSSSLSESSSSEEAAHESYTADAEDGDTQRQDSSQTESQTSHSLLSSRLSASTEPFRHYSNIRDRADLLCAQGRILRLETVVESMERANKRARVEEEIEEEGAGVREAAKLHKVGLNCITLAIIHLHYILCIICIFEPGHPQNFKRDTFRV